MDDAVTRAIELYDSGRLTRRQLVGLLGSLVVALSGSGRTAAGEQASTFEAVELNHIALRVTDVERSRNFYVKHLGLKVNGDCGAGSCFLSFGRNFLALFRGDEAGMDHYCYAVRDFDLADAEDKLEAAGLKPEVHRAGGRIYFEDPDGLTVQLSSATHGP